MEKYYREQLAEVYGKFLMTTEITKSSKVSEANSLQQSVVDYAPKSQQAIQYNLLCDEILSKIDMN